MTTVAPVNPRGNAIAVRKPEDGWPEENIPAGMFNFYSRDDCDRAGILFGCPCGCGQMMSIGFDTVESARPRWHWDGNEDHPTTTPSILIYQMNERGETVGEHWHGFLTNGEFRSC